MPKKNIYVLEKDTVVLAFNSAFLSLRIQVAESTFFLASVVSLFTGHLFFAMFFQVLFWALVVYEFVMSR